MYKTLVISVNHYNIPYPNAQRLLLGQARYGCYARCGAGQPGAWRQRCAVPRGPESRVETVCVLLQKRHAVSLRAF